MPPKAKPAAKKGGKAPKSHKLCDPLTVGVELVDMIKGKWRIGKPVGQGGFGLLYLASRSSDGAKSDPQFVVKVEPFSNGALFSELSFYQRVAKADLIDQWASEKKLKSLGMPKYIAAGCHEQAKEKQRFMVMERFGTDLQKKFEENGRRFARKTILILANQIIDTLEYIHSREYVHADIKASNLLLGYKNNKANQAYLVDYGLAFRYTVDNKHKEYKEDPKRCHDGTIEFTSIDAHRGVSPSRRGDMEILGYCMLQWFCSRLPWEDKLDNAEYVRDQKVKYMGNIPSLMKACFPNSKIPEEVQKYLQYVKTLKYEQQPDYAKCKNFFSEALKNNGFKNDGKLDFTTTETVTANATPKRSKAKKRKSAEEAVHNISQTSFDLDSSGGESPPKRARKAGRSPKAKSPQSRIKSPARKGQSPPSNRGVKRILSPANRQTGESPARRRAKDSTPAQKAASPRQRAAAKTKKPVRAKASVACQTSPGLKGLERSRKKKS